MIDFANGLVLELSAESMSLNGEYVPLNSEWLKALDSLPTIIVIDYKTSYNAAQKEWVEHSRLLEENGQEYSEYLCYLEGKMSALTKNVLDTAKHVIKFSSEFY